MNDSSAWTLRGTSAHLTTEFLEGTLNVQRPDLGITAITSRAADGPVHLASASVLGVAVGSQPAELVEATDSYTRGDDLIVTCRLRSGPDLGLQIYWRCFLELGLRSAGVEAIVSAQTDLLDRNPASFVRSQLPSGEVLSLTAGKTPAFQPLTLDPEAPTPSHGAILIRLANVGISYLEMIHPSDDQGATVSLCDGHLITLRPILTERLEKGVIRRSRLRAMFLPGDNDLAVAYERYQQFASSPPPLTT